MRQTNAYLNLTTFFKNVYETFYARNTIIIKVFLHLKFHNGLNFKLKLKLQTHQTYKRGTQLLRYYFLICIRRISRSLFSATDSFGSNFSAPCLGQLMIQGPKVTTLSNNFVRRNPLVAQEYILSYQNFEGHA